MYERNQKGQFIKGFKNPLKRQIELSCEECGKSYFRRKSRVKESRFCSRRCCALWVLYNKNKDKFFNRDMSGKNNPAWKGGKRIVNGYVLVSVGNKKKVQEHRLIMEQHLKRKLSPKERIHHINGDRIDNRLENLKLCASQSEHIRKYHGKKN